jgi:hypothetical protein
VPLSAPYARSLDLNTEDQSDWLRMTGLAVWWRTLSPMCRPRLLIAVFVLLTVACDGGITEPTIVAIAEQVVQTAIARLPTATPVPTATPAPTATPRSGETLWVRVNVAKSVPHVAYEAMGSDGTPYKWVIKPSGNGTELAYVEVTLVNLSNWPASFVINEFSSELRTFDGVAHKPLNPVAKAFRSEASEPANTTVGRLPLWNPVTLNEVEQIEGFMVFEVLTGSTLKEFIWYGFGQAQTLCSPRWITC